MLIGRMRFWKSFGNCQIGEKRKQKGFCPRYQCWTELTPGSHAEFNDNSRIGSWSLRRRWVLKWHTLLACLLAKEDIREDRTKGARDNMLTVAHCCIWASVSRWSVGSEMWAVRWVKWLRVTTGGMACLRSLEQCGALSGTSTRNRRKPCSCLFLRIAMCCRHFDCFWPGFWLRPNNKINGGTIAIV